MDRDLKKWEGVGDGGNFILPTYAADPMLIIYPLNRKGYMISI